ncbi:endolytic transglycosylase MltG [Allostreptomyces psammosilenae]|uniref:Endolytic murein transglycosylase n=1 Tax=Allostreptomyces psammosilenae TaxID=1892865 RepID=A0A853A3D9_9ACTN|nr:endolytic transglycosylase MltG [Allostreptomyces psammosilenae]NYI04998.1 putative YceG family protein [Allostreptomyces psammosilenae]
MSELGLATEPSPHGRRADRRKNNRRRKKKKRGGGCAVFVALVVVLGGVGAGGWWGYTMLRDRFAANEPPADFTGEGTGEVAVEVPEGAGATQIAALLLDAGVIASQQAFINEAYARPDDAARIQPGVYPMRQEMSAQAAMDLMIDPANANRLTVPEGMRATAVYALIDGKLELAEGTTEQVAEEADLGLPEWAEGNVEGFLFPSTYNVGEDTTPEQLLTEMVDQAEQQFEALGLVDQAEELGYTPHELLTIASLVQAEGKTSEDFGKVARVIYNRLLPDNTETNGYLEFDSTYNYAMNQSTLNLDPEVLRNTDHEYNTYYYTGLPPGPISNPGAPAIEAALNPTPGDWYYFVSVTEDDTRFSETYEEHQQHVQEFNANQEGGDE